MQELILLNKWILNELSLLQKDYFYHLENGKWEINLITEKLIKFVKDKFSQKYLELIKIPIFLKNLKTQKIILFVFQQLLIMLHPIMPFITDNLYTKITGEEILESKIQVINFENNKDLWLIDCCLILINTINNLKKENSNKFIFELSDEWANKLNFEFNFNIFLKFLTKNEIILKKENIEKLKFVSIFPFGVLWYNSLENNIKDFKKKIKFLKLEYNRSKNLLKNKGFLNKAPKFLLISEKEKFLYYKKELQILKQEIKK